MSGYKRVNFYELCRLCATNQQKEKTHIFQEEGRKIQLQNKIQSCLSLNVCENDFLPKVICSKCLRSLEVCYFFRQECVTSESMLSSYFKNYRYTEDFKKSGKVYIKDTATKTTQFQEGAEPPVLSIPTGKGGATNQPVEGVPFYTVQLPTTTTTTVVKNEPKLIQNQNQQQVAANAAYNLNTINLATIKTAPQKTNELSNVVVNANGEVINIAAQLVDIESIINQAGIQKKTTNNRHNKRKDQIIKIDLTNNDETYDTGQKFDKNKSKFASYQIKVEEQKAPTVIFNNLNEFNQNTTNFNNYPQVNGGGNIYTNPTTNNQINLVNATTNIVATSNLICGNSNNMEHQQNNQSTVNLNVLNQDLGQNSQFSSGGTSVGVVGNSSGRYGPNNTSQKISETITINNNNNNNNNSSSNNNNNNNKIHTCEVCQKTFKRREHLYQHVKLHTGFRPYMCENCNKSFMRKEHLLRHMTSHSGQKNFTCNICDKSFSRNDNLLKHKKTHDKQTSYTCEICQKHFVMKHYYLAHKLTHDGDNRCNLNNVWNVLKT